MRTRGTRIRVVGAIVLVVAALWPLVSLVDFPTSLTAVVLPTVVAFSLYQAGERLRLNRLIIAGGSAAISLVYTQLVVIGGLDMTGIPKGLAQGIQRILSSNPPIVEPTWPLVPVVLVCWGVGTVASRDTFRPPSVRLPAVAAIVFVLSFVLVVGGLPDPNGAFVSAALVVVVVGLLHVAAVRGDIRSDGEEREGFSKLVASPGFRVLAFVAVSLMLAGTTVALIPSADRPPARPRLSPNVSSKEPDSPLLVVRQVRDGLRSSGGEDAVVMKLTGELTEFVHLATLSFYDGRTWEVAERFQTTNGRVNLPLPVTPANDATEVGFLSVEAGLTGGWVPFHGRPTQFLQADVLEPLGSGAVAFLRASEGTARFTMKARSFGDVTRPSDLPDERVLAAGTPPEGRPIADQVCRAIVARYTEDNSGVLDGRLDGLSCGVDAVGARLSVKRVEALMTMVSDRRSSVIKAGEDSPSSELLSQVLTLMSTRKDDTQVNYRLGSPEQFATAGALFLQSFGIPAVIATGFRNAEPRDEVRASEAWSWIEVPTIDKGWVALDPTPTDQTTPKTESAAAETATPETTTPSTIAPSVVSSDSTGAKVSPVVTTDGASGRLTALLAAGVFFLSVLALLRTFLNRRRRSRRCRGGPREEMIGAWQNLLETAYGAGVTDQRSLTASEITARITEASDVSAEELPAEVLIRGANVAIYAISEPTDILREEFLSAARSTESRLRKSMSPVQRIRTWLRPMPPRMLRTSVGHQRVERRLRVRLRRAVS